MWAKREIDKIEMFHLLIKIYGMTAAGFGKVALQKLILEEAGLSVRSKASALTKALTTSGLLIYEGYGRKSRRYKWNLKEWGAVSIPIAEAMIHETRRQQSVMQNEYHKRRRRRLKSLTTNN